MKPSESELRQLVESTPLAMVRTDSHGHILWANDAFARLVGYSHAELVELPTSTLYRDVGERTRLLDTYGETHEIIIGLVVHWQRRDGTPLTVQMYPRVFEHAELGPCFDIGIVDITELQRQRIDLERTATTLDLVVGQLPAIYWVVDEQLRILRTGGAIQRVLGYRPELFIGTTIDHVHGVEPASVEPVSQHRRALAGEIVTYATEYRGKLLDNTVAPYRIDGEIVGAIGSCVDVTTARALERRMVDAQRAESLGVLAGGLAHDFNNLLVAILGNADLALREIPRGTPGRGEIENIRLAGRRAAELTDQLLAYAGRTAVVPREIAPAPVVAELLRISSSTLSREIDVRVDIPADLALRADPSQLRQAVLNLVTNAREALATSTGSIAISARAIQHDGLGDPDDVLTASAGPYVLIEVADTGPGVTDEARRRMFEPFFTTKPSGHGLGLAAVLGIVRSHGGGLRVVTAPDAGARFQLLWPAADPAVAIAVAPAPVRKKTVLVVDDEALVRDVIARMLEDLGYVAITAPDGATAIALVDAQPVDLAIVDLSMPQMSGADVIAQIRARRPALPIVLCSGYDRERKGPVPADAYLPKPFQLEALEQTLAKLLA